MFSGNIFSCRNSDYLKNLLMKVLEPVLNLGIQEKYLCQACNFIKKETLAQVFSCEFYGISKNTFSYRTPSGGYILWLYIFG